MTVGPARQEKNEAKVAAIVLAAGLSSRMGYPKPLLPFGERTAIEQILTVLQACQLNEIVVVVGHEREAVAQQLAGWPVRTVFNPQYESGEMLASVQVGLQALKEGTSAALLVLGDQPLLEQSVVETILEAHRAGLGEIVVPSYNRRRGHPLLIARRHWEGVLALEGGETLRDFLHKTGEAIYHCEVQTASILRDVDTPEDYGRQLADFGREDET